ncbi:hypothetical protein HAX54_049944, partial [Datura stramonium]|nr:hypothetical protein [Datura stramonium]
FKSDGFGCIWNIWIEVEEEGMDYARIKGKKINRCNAMPTRQAARGSSKIGTIGHARHRLPRRYRPCEVPAVLGDGRCEAPNSPCDGACTIALLQRVSRRAAALVTTAS